MSKFWQKQYISKYTGAEIDAAVAAGSQVPEIDIEDAGKILAVDAEGKIVAKDPPLPENAATGAVMVKTADGWVAATENSEQPGDSYSKLLNNTKHPVNPDSISIPYNKRTGDVLHINNYLDEQIPTSDHGLTFTLQTGSMLGFTTTPPVNMCFIIPSVTTAKIITALLTDLPTIISNGSGTVTVNLTNALDENTPEILHNLINSNSVSSDLDESWSYNNTTIETLNFLGYPTPVYTLVGDSTFGTDSTVSGSIIISITSTAVIKIDFVFIVDSDGTAASLNMYCTKM